VDTTPRKDQLLRALSAVSKNPAVRINIISTAEQASQQTGRETGSFKTWQNKNASGTIAVDRELRDYFSNSNQADRLDEVVNTFSSRTVNRAYRTLFHAIELKQLIDRFAAVDMRTVSPDARAKWLRMMRSHAIAFQRESAELRAEVQPIFSAGLAPSTSNSQGRINNDAELSNAVRRLHKLALGNVDGFRAAFTVSTHSSSSAIKSSQFWSALLDSQNLAAQIARYAEE
jgi:hypothetical protein